MSLSANLTSNIINNLIVDLDGPFAVKVEAACFRDGEEDEHIIDFFRLWGRVVRRHYNGRTTQTFLQFVEGDDLELFDTFYGRS